MYSVVQNNNARTQVQAEMLKLFIVFVSLFYLVLVTCLKWRLDVCKTVLDGSGVPTCLYKCSAREA